MGIKLKGTKLWSVDAIVRVNGKQCRKRETVEGTKAKAEERYLQLKQELRGKPQSAPRSLKTFGEAISSYKEEKGTFNNGYIFTRLEESLGDCLISDLRDRFFQFIQLLKKEKVKRGNQIMPGTINKYIGHAKAICNYAVRYSNLKKSPINDYPLIKLNNARDRVLSPDEQIRLFNSIRIKAPYLEPAVKFCLRVPIRKMELVGMKKDQVNLFQNVVYLREGTTKNGSGAILPIPPDMLEHFQNIPSESEYVFYRYEKKNKRYVSLGDFRKAWKAVLKHAKIKDFHIHDTRHQAAAFLGRNGTPESVIMKIGNWKTASVFRRYRHIYTEEITEAVRWKKPNCRRFVDTSTGTD